jgi:hypothetical protein
MANDGRATLSIKKAPVTRRLLFALMQVLPARSAAAPTAPVSSATTVTAAAAATVTTAAPAIAASAAAKAARPPLLLSGVVDVDRATVEVAAVQSRLSRFSFLGRRHLNERETLRPSGLPIGDDIHCRYLTVLSERLLEGLFGGTVREIADIQSCRAHVPSTDPNYRTACVRMHLRTE